MRGPRFLTALVILGTALVPACTTGPTDDAIADAPTVARDENADPGVAAALASVETPLATGSGILLPGEILVTTAHVVWPHRSATVRFSDGSTATGLEVTAVDWAADIALIDLSSIPVLPEAVDIGSTDPSVGDPVSLVGFPAAGGTAPTAVTGTLTGTRVWAEGDLEYLESDAVIGGGHSGGALVDQDGAVIGITTIETRDGRALAISGRDVADRVDGMLAGVDTDGVGDRWLEDLAASDPQPPANPLDESTWILAATAGEEVALEAGTGVLSGSVVGPDGFLETTLDAGSMRFVPTITGPHFATVVPGEFAGVLELSGNVPLQRMGDPDHGQAITPGDSIVANIDRPGDLDWFTIDLVGGESIVVSATSPNADLAIFIWPAGALDGPGAADSSDGAGGVLGSDARLEYTATVTGRHVLAVFDETQFGPGAYVVAVAG